MRSDHELFDAALPPALEERLDRLGGYRVRGRVDEVAWDLADELFLRRQGRGLRDRPDLLAVLNTYGHRSQAAKAHAGGRHGPLVWTSAGRSRWRRLREDFPDSPVGQVCFLLLAVPRVRRYR